MMEQERAFNGVDVVRFLRYTLPQSPGTLLVIWDGSLIHRGQAVNGLLTSEVASLVQLEQLLG
jgi:hypothetical protein